jgi:enoyl-CoA hydratase
VSSKGARRFGTGADADAIVITGAGRAFCAGDDLKMTEGLDAAGFRALIAAFQALTLVVLQPKILVIGALNGLVVGGAAEWTLSFDARIGCKATEYLFPENNVGLTVTNGASYLLPRLLGGRALSTRLTRRSKSPHRPICTAKPRTCGRTTGRSS